MKLIIDVEKDYYEMLKYNVEHGQEYKPFEIIANGTPYEPKGDLISREALKKYARIVNDKDLGRLHVVDVSDIDNAPIVEDWKLEHKAYNEGFKDGVDQGIKLSERPQGEWIKEDNGKTTDVYRCSICGRSIMLCKNADLSKYPFCHCGADMKGGAEE